MRDRTATAATAATKLIEFRAPRGGHGDRRGRALVVGVLVGVLEASAGSTSTARCGLRFALAAARRARFSSRRERLRSAAAACSRARSARSCAWA